MNVLPLMSYSATQVKLIVEVSAAVRVVYKLEAPHYATLWPSYYLMF